MSFLSQTHLNPCHLAVCARTLRKTKPPSRDTLFVTLDNYIAICNLAVNNCQVSDNPLSGNSTIKKAPDDHAEAQPPGATGVG